MRGTPYLVWLVCFFITEGIAELAAGGVFVNLHPFIARTSNGGVWCKREETDAAHVLWHSPRVPKALLLRSRSRVCKSAVVNCFQYFAADFCCGCDYQSMAVHIWLYLIWCACVLLLTSQASSPQAVQVCILCCSCRAQYWECCTCTCYIILRPTLLFYVAC